MKRLRKKIILCISVVIIAFLGIIVYLSQFHMDLSQKYRSIDGFENIVFKDNWTNQCFRLCIWGLTKTENYDEFIDNRNYDKASYEYQLLVEKANAQYVEQVVTSPDGKYILYVERIYHDDGSGLTDNEDVFYKVYSLESDTSTTIFSGFKQFLLVDWK